MAEINELLSRAAEESEGLARDATRARETVEQLLRLGSVLAEVVDAGQTETHQRLDQITARLGEAEQDLAREAAAAQTALTHLLTATRRLQADTSGFVARVQADLAALRAERDHALHDAEAGARSVEEAAARYLDRL